MSTNKTLRDIRRYANDLGLESVIVSKNKHIKLRVTAPDGRNDTMTIAVSGCSDHELKLKHSLKHFANGGAV